MKKFIIFLLFIICGLIVWQTTRSPKDISVSEENDWRTYQKTEKKVSSHPSTKDELDKINVRKKENTKKRMPASKKDTFNGRTINADNPDKYNYKTGNFQISNKENPDWKDTLASDLLRFQDSTTKILIKEEESFVIIRQGTGRLVEKVVITYLHNHGKKNAAHALVDSETGKIITIWNRTRYENFVPKKSGMLPKGQI